MSFVFLESDALDKKFKSNASAAVAGIAELGPGGSRAAAIRRPYRGIEIKDDTFSTLSIIDGNGRPIELISESSTDESQSTGRVYNYADYIIQRLEEQRVEKRQIIETFGDAFVFMYGERPRMASISGILLNTADFNWRSQFMANYEQYLRGTKLVQRNARAFLTYDTIVLECYPLEVSATMSSEEPYYVQFSMTVLVTNHTDFSAIGSTSYPDSGKRIDLATVNREIVDKQKRAVATDLAVREANFNAYLEAGGGGIGGALSRGIRGINNILSTVKSALNSVNNVLAGQVVRIPPGLAGYYQTVSEFQVAIAGSISPWEADFFAERGMNIRVAKPAQFAAIDPGLYRTKFSKNLDEYPFASDPLGMNLVAEKRLALEADYARRRGILEVRAFQLGLAQAAATGVDKGLTTMADIVKLARKGFVLSNMLRKVAQDPSGAMTVLKSSLGVNF